MLFRSSPFLDAGCVCTTGYLHLFHVCSRFALSIRCGMLEAIAVSIQFIPGIPKPMILKIEVFCGGIVLGLGV